MPFRNNSPLSQEQKLPHLRLFCFYPFHACLFSGRKEKREYGSPIYSGTILFSSCPGRSHVCMVLGRRPGRSAACLKCLHQYDFHPAGSASQQSCFITHDHSLSTESQFFPVLPQNFFQVPDCNIIGTIPKGPAKRTTLI